MRHSFVCWDVILDQGDILRVNEKAYRIISARTYQCPDGSDGMCQIVEYDAQCMTDSLNDYYAYEFFP